MVGQHHRDHQQLDHAADAWPLAMTRVAEATGDGPRLPRQPPWRHFADSVRDHLYQGMTLDAALEAAITQWMGWTIGRRTSKDYGIPRGRPYLTGFVLHAGVMAEDEVA